MSSEGFNSYSQQNADLDVTQCRGDNAGDGCAEVFPNKKAARLCATCFLVDVRHKDNPQEQQRYCDMAKCTGCGMCSKNMVGTLCGACKQLAAAPPELGGVGQTQTSLQMATQSTSQGPSTAGGLLSGFQDKMNAAKATKAAIQNNNIALLRQSRTSNTCIINMFCIFMNDKNRKPINAIRVQPGSYPADRPLSGLPLCLPQIFIHLRGNGLDIIQDMVVTRVNNRFWEDNTQGKLEHNDYWICFPENVDFIIGEDATLGQIYDTHVNLPTSKKWWFEGGPTSTGGRRKLGVATGDQYITFWVVLRIPKIEKQLGSLPEDLFASTGKRALEEESDEEELRSTKRPAPEPLVSTFCMGGLGSSFGRPVSKTPETVKLVFTKIEHLDDGEVYIDWEDGNTVDVTNEAEPIAHRSSKLVYKMISGNKVYVAKRFAEIPDRGLPRGGANASQLTQALTLVQNEEYLTAELRTQYRGDYFLKAYYCEARKRQMSVTDDFEFIDCQIAHEVIGVSQTPSKASGITSADYIDQTMLITQDRSHEDGPRVAVTWLIEPLHTQHVTKYSGTLTQSNKQTLPYMTMSSFTHFTWAWSLFRLVFVDLQSSTAMSTGNVSKRVLFDAMTHSEDKGETGPGDHGEDGIKVFQQKHYCNNLCRDLGLEPFPKSVGDNEYGKLLEDVGLGPSSAKRGGTKQRGGRGGRGRGRGGRPSSSKASSNDPSDDEDNAGRSLQIHD
ncbi:hypothetical protein PM082_018520 [Marasmius tenuissimus]|nr:hypothetical protein PM082_018520 [Marasmius tenuissimus]